MTKRFLTALTIVMLFLPAGSLWAQQPGIPTNDASGKKIGFLQFAIVLEGTEEAKIEIAKVRNFVDQRQQEYDTKKNELEELKRQFIEQERSLNEETKLEMQRTIQENETNLRRLQEDIQREIENRRNALFTRLSGKVQGVLAEFAQEGNYGAILFVDQLQGYFDPGLDVTQEIIRRYNERYPVEGAAATP